MKWLLDLWDPTALRDGLQRFIAASRLRLWFSIQRLGSQAAIGLEFRLRGFLVLYVPRPGCVVVPCTLALHNPSPKP